MFSNLIDCQKLVIELLSDFKNMTKFFFAAIHGKRVVDGIGATVKSLVSNKGKVEIQSQIIQPAKKVKYL